jgi:sigma-B regulation protein RsbU (phosphoserine phosphatase)
LAEHYTPGTESVTLAGGDVLLLYTDGLTEALNMRMEQFGQANLAGLLHEYAELSASDMLQQMRRHVTAFGGDKPLADDLAMVALKVLG